MRKIVSMLLFVAMAFAVAAQDLSSEHLKFMGIPIDGPLDSFVAKLKQKGFSNISKDSNAAYLNGNFAGFTDCLVAVFTTDNGLVRRVGVSLPFVEKWSILYNNYSEMKSMLTQKYGEPESCVEEFQEYEPTDDNGKMYAVKFDRCKYQSDFETDNGNISLMINHVEMNCSVLLIYMDAQNENQRQLDALDDL